MEKIKVTNPEFSPLSVGADTGRVFFHDGRVLRAIYDKDTASLFGSILAKEWINDLFQAGLVHTKICHDITLSGAELVLEHQQLFFPTHPVENTNYMHWNMAVSLVGLAIELEKHGLFLKDAHPWNMMYSKGYPIFVDFGSITNVPASVTHWINEFYKYFAVPIWMARSRWPKFSYQYRKEHWSGFGIELFNTNVIKKLVWGPIFRISGADKSYFLLLQSLKQWLLDRKPKDTLTSNWIHYRQNEDNLDPTSPLGKKQGFIRDIISEEKPSTVLDCAANKGYFAVIAARLGARVAAFDYEETCVNECLQTIRKESLEITVVEMDFKHPTLGLGYGLCDYTAFARFSSDLVIAIGLMHHVCISQSYPVTLFLDNCRKYAKHGIIIEFIEPTDKYVKEWSKNIPSYYSSGCVITYFQSQGWFLAKQMSTTEDGLDRKFYYFKKNS